MSSPPRASSGSSPHAPTRYKVFLSFAPEDRSVATQLAERMRAAGVDPSLATDMAPGQDIAEGVRSAIDESVASIVLLSPSTAHPSSALSTEWTSILSRTWKEPSYPLYTLKLAPELETPAFLRRSLTYTLPESRDAIAKALQRLVQQVVSPVHTKPTELTEADIKRIRDRIAELRKAVGKALN